MKETVAKASFIGVDSLGKQSTINVQIGIPYNTAETDAACPLSLQGLYHHLPDMRGTDTFQALCLSIHTAKTLLKEHIKSGSKLYYLPGETSETLLMSVELLDEFFPI